MQNAVSSACGTGQNNRLISLNESCVNALSYIST